MVYAFLRAELDCGCYYPTARADSDFWTGPEVGAEEGTTGWGLLCALRLSPPTSGPTRRRWRNDGLLLLQESLSFPGSSSPLDRGVLSTLTRHVCRHCDIVKLKGFLSPAGLGSAGVRVFRAGDAGQELSRME